MGMQRYVSARVKRARELRAAVVRVLSGVLRCSVPPELEWDSEGGRSGASMYEPNVQAIISRLRDDDIVLDVGGWVRPFNRANIVMDAEPYETRGYYRTLGLPASQGGATERFTRSSWIQRDLCERDPWPLADRSADFAVCSHTLEDVRDPVWVCSELVRVAKAGYIEVPSRAAE
jgi:hypothetical protein